MMNDEVLKTVESKRNAVNDCYKSWLDANNLIDNNRNFEKYIDMLLEEVEMYDDVSRETFE